MRLLRARGIESEAQIPFGSLLELIRPALPLLGKIPGAPGGRAGERAGPAAGLGPANGSRSGAATLSLLAAYAEDAPVAVVIDDAHWLDGSSAQALLFAFRRLVADPIAVLIAVREGEPSLLDGADLPTLRLGGLTSDEAAKLVLGLTPEAAARLYGATAGNPLALLELGPDAHDLALAPEGAPVLVPATDRRGVPAPGQARSTTPPGRRWSWPQPVTAGDLTDPRARGGPPRHGPIRAGRRGIRGAGDAGHRPGGIPPSAGPLGHLRRRASRPEARRTPGARRRPARPGRRTAAPGIWPRRRPGLTRPRRPPWSRPGPAAATAARTRPPRPRTNGPDG